MDRGGQPIFQGFTPEVSPDGFWIEARKDGKPVATYSAYPIVLADTLTSHIEEEGWYPTDRESWRVCEPARAICDGIQDMAVFSGGILVAPSLRKTEASNLLVWLLPLIGRWIGVQRWDAPHFVFMVKPEIPGLGMRFRPERLEPAIEWYRGGEMHGTPRLLGYASRGFALARAAEMGAA